MNSFDARSDNVNISKNASFSLSAAPVKKLLSHLFKADFNDHFETSLAALCHIKPVVE